jgi:hypothetical protein
LTTTMIRSFRSDRGLLLARAMPRAVIYAARSTWFRTGKRIGRSLRSKTGACLDAPRCTDLSIASPFAHSRAPGPESSSCCRKRRILSEEIASGLCEFAAMRSGGWTRKDPHQDRTLLNLRSRGQNGKRCAGTSWAKQWDAVNWSAHASGHATPSRGMPSSMSMTGISSRMG